MKFPEKDKIPLEYCIIEVGASNFYKGMLVSYKAIHEETHEIVHESCLNCK